MNVRYLLGVEGVGQEDKKVIEETLEKSLKYLGKYKEKEVLWEIELSRDKRKLLYLEVMLRTPKQFFRSEVHGKDFLIMVTEASQELEQQIKKTLGKARDLRRRGSCSVKKAKTVSSEARV